MTTEPSPATLPRRAGAIALAVVTTAVALAPVPATATTFAEVTLEDLARASDLVVIGRVEHTDVLPHGPGGQPGIHTRATIQVAETLRGQPRTIIEVWAHGGRLGDRMRVVPGQATFRPGEHVALFLFDAGGGLWPTGMGRGKWTVEHDGLLAHPGEQGQLRLTNARASLSDIRTAVTRAHSAGTTR